MRNVAIERGEVWQTDGRTFTELIRQEYTNCAFSAGTVEGDLVDTLYLRWERDSTGSMLLLRPDEMAAIAWCATGVLWSDALAKLPEERHAIP